MSEHEVRAHHHDGAMLAAQRQAAPWCPAAVVKAINLRQAMVRQ